MIKQMILDSIKITKRDEMCGNLEINDLASNVQTKIKENKDFRENLSNIIKDNSDLEKLISFLSS